MTTDRRSFWPYVTLTVAGVPLTFKHRAFPGQRQALARAVAEAEIEAATVLGEASDTLKADPKADVQSALDRAELLRVGAVGWYLSRLWDGEPLEAAKAWEADGDPERDPATLTFKGPDKRELFGVAWVYELCEKADLTFDHLAACVGKLATMQPPMGSREPTAGEVDEIVVSFGVAVGTTI